MGAHGVIEAALRTRAVVAAVAQRCADTCVARALGDPGVAQLVRKEGAGDASLREDGFATSRLGSDAASLFAFPSAVAVADVDASATALLRVECAAFPKLETRTTWPNRIALPGERATNADLDALGLFIKEAEAAFRAVRVRVTGLFGWPKHGKTRLVR